MVYIGIKKGGNIMKKFISFAMVIAMVLSISVMATSSAAKQIMVDQNRVSLFVNGVALNADNFIYNGTTYVPIRAVSDALGANVRYDAAKDRADITKQGDSVAMARKLLGSKIDSFINVNGFEIISIITSNLYTTLSEENKKRLESLFSSLEWDMILIDGICETYLKDDNEAQTALANAQEFYSCISKGYDGFLKYKQTGTGEFIQYTLDTKKSSDYLMDIELKIEFEGLNEGLIKLNFDKYK